MKSKRTKAVLLHIMEDIQDIENIIRNNSKEIFQTDPILKKAIYDAYEMIIKTQDSIT